MKHTLILLTLMSFVFISCSKQKFDEIDAASIEGKWRVEKIQYTGILSDGTEIIGEVPSRGALFWVDDIVEFKDGKLYHGENGSIFFSMFVTYPGWIQYSIIDRKLYIPKQVFQSASEDAGDGWSATLETVVGEYSLPYTLTEDTWVIRYEDQQMTDLSTYEYFNCDFEYILRRVN